MRDEIVNSLQGHKADYVEIRFDEAQLTRIVYRGERLEEVGRTSSLGGNVRALAKGGWGFVSFNNIHKLRDKVELAVQQARLVGKEEFKLDQIEPIIDVVTTKKSEPVAIPLASKKQLLDEYNDIILSTPKIQTSNIGYHDSQRKITFANSEGTYIEQTKADINLRLTSIASENGQVQQVGMSLGSQGDFSAIEGLQEQVKQMAQRAVKLLSAPQAKGGEYTIVLDPVLAVVFVHELLIYGQLWVFVLRFEFDGLYLVFLIPSLIIEPEEALEVESIAFGQGLDVFEHLPGKAVCDLCQVIIADLAVRAEFAEG